MAGMTHRERVLRTLSHQERGRVPADLGATRSTSIVVPAYERLNRFLGAEEPPGGIVHQAQFLRGFEEG